MEPLAVCTTVYLLPKEECDTNKPPLIVDGMFLQDSLQVVSCVQDSPRDMRYRLSDGFLYSDAWFVVDKAALWNLWLLKKYVFFWHIPENPVYLIYAAGAIGAPSKKKTIGCVQISIGVI